MRILLSLAAVLGLFLPQGTLAFDLQGHRGARGLAPENTLPAFATALSLGVNTLELDTGITKDGIVVIAHDQTLNPESRPSSRRWHRTKRQIRKPSRRRWSR